MKAITRQARIDALDLFSDCSKSELQQIDALTTELVIPKNQVLTRAGSVAKEFIIIRSGSAQVTQRTDDGEHRVTELGTGDFLGETSLLTGRPRVATTTATTDLSVLVSSVGEFRSILEIAPSVDQKVRRASAARSAVTGALLV